MNNLEWAEQITIKPDGGGSDYNIDGIFDAAHELVDVSTEVDISTVAPVVLIKTVDLTATLTQKDQVQVGSVVYEVMDIQPDIGDITLIVLHDGN